MTTWEMEQAAKQREQDEFDYAVELKAKATTKEERAYAAYLLGVNPDSPSIEFTS